MPHRVHRDRARGPADEHGLGRARRDRAPVGLGHLRGGHDRLHPTIVRHRACGAGSEPFHRNRAEGDGVNKFLPSTRSAGAASGRAPAGRRLAVRATRVRPRPRRRRRATTARLRRAGPAERHHARHHGGDARRPDANRAPLRARVTARRRIGPAARRAARRHRHRPSVRAHERVRRPRSGESVPRRLPRRRRLRRRRRISCARGTAASAAVPPPRSPSTT